MAAPVLYGYSTTKDSYSHSNGTIIDELLTGLSIVKAASSSLGNTCPRNSDTLSYVPIGFGYDSVTGCTVQLNRYVYICIYLYCIYAHICII